MSQSVDRLSWEDQEHLLHEFRKDPRMRGVVARALRADGVRALNLSALRAALNELEPWQYPESAGQWPVLRAQIRALPRAIEKSVSELSASLSLGEKIALLRDMQEGRAEIGLAGVAGHGLGQWGAVVGAVLQVGGGLLQTKITGDIQKDIAEDQAKLQAQMEAQRLAAEKELAEKRLAVEAALRHEEIAAGAAAPATIAGMPVWLLPVLLGVGGLILFLILKVKR